MIITFDGDSGSGKTTIAKEVAKQINYPYIASGLIFRSFAFLWNLNYGNLNSIKEQIETGIVCYKWENGEAKLFINNSDQSEFLKNEDLGSDTSKLAQDVEFYNFMVEMTKSVIVKSGIKNLVIDGRSVGKVFYPNADKKFYVSASLEVRVQRRFDELKRGGINTTYEEVLSQINNRDDRDKNREHFPLKLEQDTIFIDNSNSGLESKISEVLGDVSPFAYEISKKTNIFLK